MNPPRFVGCFLLFVIAESTLLLAAESAPRTTWQAGTGREIITPPAGVWMTGYAVRTRPADGKSQDLWVKALAIADPKGERGVLVTLDLCGITREISDRVAAEIHRRHGLPRRAIMFNVSHTHCSPALEGSISGLRILPPDGQAKSADYLRLLETKIVSAVGSALTALAPATLSWGEDTATFGMNRRANTEKEAPALRAAGQLRGPSDPRVPVLAVRGADGTLRALLVSYACHNTTLSFYLWHGDYAGCAQAELEQRHPTATVLFAIGCGADINPNPRGTIELAEQHGKSLADAADRALAKPLNVIEGVFSSALEDVTLTFSRQPSEAQLEEARVKEQPNKEMHQAWAAAVTADLKRKGEGILRYAYPIQAWTLGNLTWTALGGEVVVDYALRLRKETPGNLWVFGYANDVMAYIPNERILKEGRYEGESSMIPYGRPGPWTPGLEETIISKAGELIQRTRGK
jgi:neutral ceramidase